MPLEGYELTVVAPVATDEPPHFQGGELFRWDVIDDGFECLAALLDMISFEPVDGLIEDAAVVFIDLIRGGLYGRCAVSKLTGGVGQGLEGFG